MSFVAGGAEYEDDDLDFYDFGDTDGREHGEESFSEPTLTSLVHVSEDGSPKENGTSSGSGSAGSVWGRDKSRNKGKGLSRSRLGAVSRAEEMKVLICHGDIRDVKEKLEQGFNPNTPLVGDWSPLMYACSNGRPAIVEVLLAKGAEVNYQKDMFTVLMALCSSKSSNESDLTSCCKQLLSHGARVDAHDSYHMTPLLYACDSRHREVVSLLISGKADVNKQDTRGWTPLCYAAHGGDLHLVKLLLRSGANPQLTTNLGDTPSLLAYDRSYNAIGKTLEAAINPGGGDLEEATLMPLQSSLAVPSSAPDGQVFHYGDLEVFLMGLDLPNLVPVFKSHMLKFSDLLAIREEDLEKMGVAQVGVRHTLLTAIADIHKSRWRMPYDNPYKDRVLSSREFVVALTQLAKHISYVGGTAGFLVNQTRGSPSPVVVDANSRSHARLAGEITAVRHACQDLRAQMDALEAEVYAGLGMSRSSAGRKGFGPRKKRLGIPLFLGVVGLVLLLCYRGRRGLLSGIVDLRHIMGRY